MNIYRLIDKEATYIPDTQSEKIIIATNSNKARKLANTSYMDEGPIWEDTKRVKCCQIKTDKFQILV